MNATKPGWASTEFYITLLTHVAWIATVVFHKDFSGYVQVAAVAAAGLATLVYTIQRQGLKKALLLIAKQVPEVTVTVPPATVVTAPVVAVQP